MLLLVLVLLRVLARVLLRAAAAGCCCGVLLRVLLQLRCLCCAPLVPPQARQLPPPSCGLRLFGGGS